MNKPLKILCKDVRKSVDLPCLQFVKFLFEMKTSRENVLCSDCKVEVYNSRDFFG